MTSMPGTLPPVSSYLPRLGCRTSALRVRCRGTGIDDRERSVSGTLLLMRLLSCRWAFLIAVELLGAADANAAGQAPLRPGNGVTELDLLGDGTPAMVVVGRRENFNAYSFDVTSFFVRLGNRLGVVPLFDAEKEQDSMTSSGAADCVPHDFRLVGHRQHVPLSLVVADRDYGESFVAVMPVRFRAYELVKNENSDFGWPTWRFQLRTTRTSTRAYCDVDDAFAHESIWRN
jgi:hypothetical protein